MKSRIEMSLEEAVLSIIMKGFSNPKRVYSLIKISHPNASKIKVYDLVYEQVEKRSEV